MKKKALILIIILLLILLILLSLLIGFRINQLSSGEEDNNDISTNNEINNNIQEEEDLTRDYNLFYTVESCLQTYETYLHLDYEEQVNELNQPSMSDILGVNSIESKANVVLNILDTEYINRNGLNSSNIFDILGNSTNEVEVSLKEMNLLESSNSVNAYRVRTEVKDVNTQEVTNEFFIIKLDNTNTTFSIYPMNNNDYQNINEINMLGTLENIEKNTNNYYVEMEYNESQVATRYFQEYKELMLNNTQEAYNKLDNAYKEAKFGTIEEFTQYVNERTAEIQGTQIMQYQAEKLDGYTQYVCRKTDGTYWVIHETSPNNYTVILDTYTLDLPEFIETYSTSTDAEKVSLNIQKVFEAINDGDYRYAYNKLDETFRNNTFGNIENFRTYVNENFYDENEVEYLEFAEEGDTYIYSAKIKNAQEENSEGREITLIMRLLEGTDFVMSFNME